MTQTEALIAIAKRDGGAITPAAVIAEARDPGSVLHGAFTWDDTVAAHKWRIHEAQHLIRECRITIEQNGNRRETYAFIGLSSDRDGSADHNPYRMARDVVENESLLDIAVRDAIAQLESFKGRYQHLKQLAKVWASIDEAAARK